MSAQVKLGVPHLRNPRLPDFGDESTHLWSRCWVAVGVDAMLSKPGQVLPATIGNHGVHVLRHDDGALDAGYNVFQQGSCWNIPVQCGNGYKIECPYVSCGHSRDGGVLDPRDESERRLVRQLVGDRPSRRPLLPFEQIGPILFVAMPGNRVDQLYEQISPISSWEHDLLQASAHNYSGYIRREITGNWRVIGDYLQSASELELEGVIEARVAPPNLVAVNGEGWVALATVKPISMTRSEITIAKFGETPEVQWTESWMSIIAKGGFDSIVSGPTAQWAEKFFI